MDHNGSDHLTDDVSRLPAAVGVIRQSVNHYDDPDLDHLYGDLSTTVDLLEAITALTSVLQKRITALPGIVGGLRVDADSSQVHRPEELRDLVAERLRDVVADLEPLTRHLRTAEQELAALFVDD